MRSIGVNVMDKCLMNVYQKPVEIINKRISPIMYLIMEPKNLLLVAFMQTVKKR